MWLSFLIARCGRVSGVSWSVHQREVHQHPRLLLLPVPPRDDGGRQWQDLHRCGSSDLPPRTCFVRRALCKCFRNISAPLLPLPDLRTEQCYLTHDDERCGTPINGRHRVDACCCSVGVAWGPECDECPEKGSPEYTQLCPRGPGFSHRGDFINGRPFLKGTSLHLDTESSLDFLFFNHSLL